MDHRVSLLQKDHRVIPVRTLKVSTPHWSTGLDTSYRGLSLMRDYGKHKRSTAYLTSYSRSHLGLGSRD